MTVIPGCPSESPCVLLLAGAYQIQILKKRGGFMGVALVTASGREL